MIFHSFQANSQNDPAVILYQEAINEYGFRHLKPAKERLERLIKLYPSHSLSNRAKIDLGRVMIDNREYDKAIEVLTPLTEISNPQCKEAREMLITLLLELQRFRQGVDLLEKWWKESQGNPELGRKLASFYLQCGRADEAKVLLESLLERTARRDVFDDLLRLSAKSGQLETLLSAIESRSARYKTIDYLDFTSDCYIALKEPEKAVTILEKAPETATSLLLLQKLSRLELSRNRPEKALESFRRIERIIPNDWNNEKALGHCLFLLGKKDEAISTWRKTLSGQPYPNQEFYQLFSGVLIEHNLYEEALLVFSEARTALGSPIIFAQERASVLETLNRKKEAVDEYLVALQNDPYMPEILEKLIKLPEKGSVFNLKEKIKELIPHSQSLSLKKALLEIYFREQNLNAIPEILTLVSPVGSMFDQVFFERINEALT
ncbi:tetratricopeptide repeat protein, partial [bacterium]|nr:tetratricopeptide repeat protein [bacterium]